MSDTPTRRSLLKRAGIAGAGLSGISATAMAETGSEGDVPLDDEEVWELLQEASKKEPFHAMYRHLLRDGYYPNWDETTGEMEEIGSITRPVLATPFESFDGDTVDFIVRFDENQDVGVRVLVPEEEEVISYHSSSEIIKRYEQDVIRFEKFQQFALEQDVNSGEVGTAGCCKGVKLGCKTVNGTDICAAITVLSSGMALTGVTLTVLSPVPGDEAVALATLGKVSTFLNGAGCGVAELVDGYLDCEPDDYKVCLYAANLFFPFVTVEPLC